MWTNVLHVFIDVVCLGAKEIDFLLQWTPKVLRTGADFYFDIDIKLRKKCCIIF